MKGRKFNRLTIYEVALAGNPINKESFILMKDRRRTTTMSDALKFATMLILKEDVPEVVKEELKDFAPKEGETLKVGNVSITIKKDGYDIVDEALKKELETLKKDSKKDEDIYKDLPDAVKERLERLEKEASEMKQRAEAMRLEALKKDFATKVGDEMATTIMKAYDPEKEDAIKELVEKVAGLEKMIKDLTPSQGKSGGNEDVEKMVKEGIEKLMKEKGLSLADATVQFYKENPDLVKKEA